MEDNNITIDINKLNITPATGSHSVMIRPFLEIFPYEIRKLIYAQLLTTHLLAEWDCLGGRKSTETPDKIYKQSELSYARLGMCTSIMRTNRQIWKESEEVLYGQNIFMVTFQKFAFTKQEVSSCTEVILNLTCVYVCPDTLRSDNRR
jgi:hypothetical protein